MVAPHEVVLGPADAQRQDVRQPGDELEGVGIALGVRRLDDELGVFEERRDELVQFAIDACEGSSVAQGQLGQKNGAEHIRPELFERAASGRMESGR